MKPFKNKVIIMVVGMIVSMSGMAMAQGWNSAGKGMRGAGCNTQKGAFAPSLRQKMRDAKVEVLMDVTDQSKEIVESKLRYKPMWALLDEYKVDYLAFDKKMIAKRADMIKQAVKDEQITAELGELLLLRNKSGAHPGQDFSMNKGRRGNRGGFGQHGIRCQFN